MLALSVGLPLIVIGDFNCILNEDKNGGKHFQVDQGISEFRNYIRLSGLVDLGYNGASLTWCNNRLGGARVWERLDWAFANQS